MPIGYTRMRQLLTRLTLNRPLFLIAPNLASHKNVNDKRMLKIMAIEDTAFAVILDGELEGLSMHESARRRGVTVGALYRYFDAKQSLIANLERRCLNEIRCALETQIEIQQLVLTDLDSGKTFLWKIAKVYQELLRKQSAITRLISGILANPNPVVGPDDQISSVDLMFEAIAVPIQGIACLQQGGVFQPGNATYRALVIWVMAHAILQLEKLTPIEPSTFQIEVMRRSGLNTLAQGWSLETGDLTKKSEW